MTAGVISSRPSDALIDMHAHFVTDKYISAARQCGHLHPDGMPGWPTWTVERHLELMDRHGIERSILSLSSPGVHFGDPASARALARHVNEHAAAVVRSRPDRFGFLAVLPLPDVDGATAEIDRAFDELGASGVVILTNSRGVYVGDQRLDPVLAALDRRAAITLIHPTSPCHQTSLEQHLPNPVLEFIFETTRCIFDLLLSGGLQRHPRVRIIVPHAGAAVPLLTARFEAFQTRLPAHGSTELLVSEGLGKLWWDLAGSPLPVQLPALCQLADPTRIVYGSDYCWTPSAAVAEQIDSIDQAVTPFVNDTWRHITTRNARIMLAG